MRIPQPKFNVIELAMFGTLIAVLGYLGGVRDAHGRLFSRGLAELQQLADRYGPARDSEHGEEWVVRDFFRDQRNGVFVDIGANHYRRYSNTYFLETQLGWSGLAVEPQVKFAEGYAANRPNTVFVPLFVSDVSNSHKTLYVPANDLVASSDRAFAESESRGSAEGVDTRTTTLDDILDRHRITHIDFLSMDIELHEPEALKGFSIDRFQPRLAVVESHSPVRQQILDYFTMHGYVVVGKYLGADAHNLWFAPLNEAPPRPWRDADRQ